jgi:hypothetical protein
MVSKSKIDSQRRVLVRFVPLVQRLPYVPPKAAVTAARRTAPRDTVAETAAAVVAPPLLHRDSSAAPSGISGSYPGDSAAARDVSVMTVASHASRAQVVAPIHTGAHGPAGAQPQRRQVPAFTVQQALASVSQKQQAASGGGVWGKLVKLVSSASGLLADGVAAAAVAVAPPPSSQQRPVNETAASAPSSSHAATERGSNRASQSTAAAAAAASTSAGGSTAHAAAQMRLQGDRSSATGQGGEGAVSATLGHDTSAQLLSGNKSRGKASTAKHPFSPPPVVCRLSYLNLSGQYRFDVQCFVRWRGA